MTAPAHLARMLLVAAFWLPSLVVAHPDHQDAAATYLANEGVMVSQGEHRILFDPLFDEGFGTYPLVPAPMRDALIVGSPPYEGVDVVFVSHGHDDHFSADALNRYLDLNPDVRLVAPAQAIDMMRADEGWQPAYEERIRALTDRAERFRYGAVLIAAMQVDHSGDWPELQNYAYRVTLDGLATVMHLGDAEGSDTNFAPHRELLDRRRTDLAMVPYWWLDEDMAETLDRLNAEGVIGIHVPRRVPRWLQGGEADYFSEPGERRTIIISSDHE